MWVLVHCKFHALLFTDDGSVPSLFFYLAKTRTLEPARFSCQARPLACEVLTTAEASAALTVAVSGLRTAAALGPQMAAKLATATVGASAA